MEPHREISASLFMTLIIIVTLYLYCKITSTKLNPVNRMPAVKNESWKLVYAFYNKLASLEAMLVQNPADLITGVDCRATGAAKNEIPLQSGMSKKTLDSVQTWKGGCEKDALKKLCEWILFCKSMVSLFWTLCKSRMYSRTSDDTRYMMPWRRCDV